MNWQEIIAAGTVQLIILVFYLGRMVSRIEALEDRANAIPNMTMELAAIKGQLSLVVPELERVRSRLDAFLDRQSPS